MKTLENSIQVVEEVFSLESSTPFTDQGSMTISELAQKMDDQFTSLTELISRANEGLGLMIDKVEEELKKIKARRDNGN